MSREEILEAIKQNKPESSPLPDLKSSAGPLPDKVAKFREMVTVAGAKCIEVASMAQVKTELDALFQQLDVKTVFTRLTDPDINTVDHDALKSPHDLKSVDMVLEEGGLAVAENGAIWVEDEAIKFRAAWYITQHLAIMVKRENIVDNMLEAYQKVKLNRPGFSCFISGPSKTADIEQSLVIGAHGARSLTVFLI